MSKVIKNPDSRNKKRIGRSRDLENLRIVSILSLEINKEISELEKTSRKIVKNAAKYMRGFDIPLKKFAKNDVYTLTPLDLEVDYRDLISLMRTAIDDISLCNSRLKKQKKWIDQAVEEHNELSKEEKNRLKYFFKNYSNEENKKGG